MAAAEAQALSGVARRSAAHAAAMQHAGAIETGLVRAALQAGDYRQALALCAHTAGAHADEPAAGALHRWLPRAR